MKLSTILIATAAAAVVAISAGSATALAESGTTACKFPETPCPAVEHYLAGTSYKVHMPKGAVAAFTGAPVETSCEASEFAGKQENTGGPAEDLHISMESGAFTSCENFCTVTVISPGTWDVSHVLGFDNGTVDITGFKIKTLCSGIECIYSGNISTGIEIKGGSTAKLVATKAPIPWTGGTGGVAKCGSQIQWDGLEYEFSSPEPLYITGS